MSNLSTSTTDKGVGYGGPGPGRLGPSIDCELCRSLTPLLLFPISKVFSNFQNAVHRRSVHPVDGKQRLEQGPVTYDDDNQVTDDKRTSCNLQSPLHQ